jgi:hypothetical protein
LSWKALCDGRAVFAMPASAIAVYIA